LKIIRSVRLWMSEGASGKIYEVDLVDLETPGTDTRFLVNFRYGRRGKSLRDGTKTPSPIAFSSAEKTFDSVVVAKVNDGYRRLDEEAVTPRESAASTDRSGRDAALLNQLAACLRSAWPDKQRDRLFWRLGVIRLATAYPQLAAMAKMLTAKSASYSLVFALARCGGAQALSLLQEIADVNISLVTRDYAAYSLASELMGPQRQRPRPALPQVKTADRASRLDAAISVADGPALVQTLREEAESQPGFANQFLIALAHRALAEPAARAALLAALRAINARPPFVQVLRRLFKYADLTDDGQLFAETARQFELAEPMYRTGSVYRGKIWLPGARQGVQLSEEQASANPRIALSDQTLLYFKRRAWRMLRKRAELGQDAFAAMACELLLAFTDADGGHPRHWSQYVRVGGRYELVKYSADAFSRVWSLSHVLYAAAPTSSFNPNALTHSHIGSVRPSLRGEAFQALWDAQPRRLLRIAAEARNRPAALFAITALAQGPKRPDELEGDALAGLLTSPYPEVGQFAGQIARRLIDAGRVDAGIVVALLGADLLELRELGIAAINQRTDWPWSDTALALTAMTSPIELIQDAMRGWLKERPATSGQRTELTEAFAAWLSSLPAELQTVQRDGLRFAVSLLPLLWPDNNCPLAPELIEQLTGHPSPDVQAASIDLLAVTAVHPEELPQPFWQAILNARIPEIRAASMHLLGRLDTASLSAHHETILAAALSEYPDLRVAARPLAVRLATADTGFAERLRDTLMTVLFHAEPAEGHAADMVQLFVESLPQAFATLDRGTLWRLLQAKAKGARLLGARALGTAAASELSVKQIARLGNHPYAAVRHWAIHTFEADESRFRAEPEDAVLLVESEWDDVRSTAIACFTAWPVEALSSAALAVMADSTRPAVQDGARQLLRRRLGNDDTIIVLARLLEHPSSSFHLFVTELITDQTLSDPFVFEKFLIQARIILMQINRGRVAKDRVLAVLRREALARQDRADAIWRLLYDLTLSTIVRDKAPALMILRDIAQAWPTIAMPVSVTPARSFDARSSETAA